MSPRAHKVGVFSSPLCVRLKPHTHTPSSALPLAPLLYSPPALCSDLSSEKTALWMPSAPLAERISACTFVIAVSAIFLYVISFAHSTTLHNAAHDVRHAFAFPCH